MSISNTVKKIMPYLRGVSEYILLRLSSQAVEMDDGTTLEQKVTSLNSLIASKVDTSSVMNNILTTEEGFVLDARQGKELDNKITELNGKLDGIGESAEVGKYGEWSISTSDYYAIGNKLPTIDNDYYKTVSTGSSITVKKSGVYIITFESNCIISSDNGTIWARLTLNGHEIKNIQNNGGNGYNSVTYTEVLRLNENDAINAFLSASGTVRSIGNDSLNITRISA